MPQNDFLLLSDGIPAGSSRRDGEALAVTPQPCTVTPAEGTELGAERGCWSSKHQILTGSTQGRAGDGTQQRGQHSRKATGQGDAARGKQSPAAELCLQDKTLPAAPGQQGWDKPQLGGGQHGLQAAAETSHFAPALHSSTSLPKWILAKFKLQCSRFFQ